MLNIQEVYEQYFTVVYRYLLSLSHNTHIAEELTQETFFKALKKVDDFRGDCDLRVWLCQISKNTYYDYQKKNKKYVPESQEETEDIFTSDLLQNFSDKETAFRFTRFCTDFRNRTKKFFPFVCLENCHLVQFPRCLAKAKAGQELLITEHVKKSGRNWIMKISCNIIEDLLPLYVDDMVSEDSRQLVEEHLKACPTCRRMQEEIMRENHLTDVKKGSDSVQTNKMEAELLKKIRCKIRKKRIASVLLAVAIVLAAGGIGHYWYYDKENYISWDEANISVKDGKVYSTVNPLGRMKSILSVDQKNMFYMLSETMWTHKEYPSDSNTENELWNLQDFQEAYERGADTVTDETSFPTGIEHVYYVDPENVKEAFKLWDYQDEPEKAQQKEEELAAKCHLIWSAY